MHVLRIHRHPRSTRAVHHRLEIGEGHADGHIHALRSGKARQQRLDVVLGLDLGLVHLPVARDQGRARTHKATPAPSSPCPPGSVLPSSSCNVAPPPVDRWSTESSSPNCASAAAESPPPTTVTPLASAPASATARVPAANGANSNAPIGPFQKTEPAPAI